MDCNQTVICGEIKWLGALRYTPAGTPAIDFVVEHHSRQREANMPRQANCVFPGVALGQSAIAVAELKIGCGVKITGFLNRKSQNNQQLVLHVNHIIKI